jgi:hypothetical protein
MPSVLFKQVKGTLLPTLFKIQRAIAFTITAVNTAPLEGDASRLNFWKYREVGDNETNPMPIICWLSY